MRSKELSVELRDRIVSRYRSGEGYQNISGALKVPKNAVASSFLNGRSFEPPRLFRRRAFVGVVTKNPMVTLTELQSSSVWMGEPSRRT
jgi:hypothetical protein